jgi:hypothetical protein
MLNANHILVVLTLNCRTVGIGLSHRHLPVTSVPGWLPGSWGYHGDDGRKFVGNGRGVAYGETFGAGDVVGCLVSENGDVKFTKNGVLLDVVAEGVTGKLIPAVGMWSVGAKAKVNFGPGGFRYEYSKVGKDEKS